jgi:ATP-dependent Clp protease protease subunit
MFREINKLQYGKKNVDDRVCLLFGEITIESAQNIIEWIININNGVEIDEAGNELPRPKVLSLIVNSPGGDLAAAWTMIDAIRSSKIPVRTHGTGQIASAALLIVTAGKKGFRSISENTSVMSHQYTWGSDTSKYHELQAKVREYDIIHSRLTTFWKKTTGLTEEDIQKKLMPPSDIYMTPKEAKHLGLCDLVVDMI